MTYHTTLKYMKRFNMYQSLYCCNLYTIIVILCTIDARVSIISTTTILVPVSIALSSLHVLAFQPSHPLRRYTYTAPTDIISTAATSIQYNNHVQHVRKDRRRQQQQLYPTFFDTTSRIRLSNGNSNNNFDYEYIPPRNAEEGRARMIIQQQQQQTSPSSSILTSTYPIGTPAGLRGEAVRSAIRSRCIGYNFQNTPLQCGIVHIQSTSTSNNNSIQSVIQFLNGKFTQHFTTTSSSSSSSSSSVFKEASLLNGKGRIIDKIGIAIPNCSTNSNNSNNNNGAYLITSPGHTSQSLFNILDPYIFPMDQIQINPINDKNNHNNNLVMFHLLSSKLTYIQECWEQYILPMLPKPIPQQQQQLPSNQQCVQYVLKDNDNDQNDITLLIIPTAGLPTCAGFGYTFCFWSNNRNNDNQQQQHHIGHIIWETIISENCPNGPIEIGTLEYDTLRIECGQPAYNFEMTAKITSKIRLKSNIDDEIDIDIDTSSSMTSNLNIVPASPLELGLDYTIDTTNNKGCYQGQEGIASIMKNPRGPPRTLYQIIFPDETNIYDYQSDGEYVSSSSSTSRRNSNGNTNNGEFDSNENLTRTPQVNDVLYVLGSNEEIMVGHITSVAEPSGTGEPITIALGLIRRADSIQKSMKQLGIDMPNPIQQQRFNDKQDNDVMDRNSNDDGGSILIQPPPIDVLDGLEVIIGNTYTIGTLRMLPTKKRHYLFTDDDIPSFVQNLPSEQDMYDLVPLTKMENDNANNIPKSTTISSSTTMIQNATIILEDDMHGSTTSSDTVEVQDDNDGTTTSDVNELDRAIIEAENAAKEAQRKLEKLELLRQRAEEAIERRKKKNQK